MQKKINYLIILSLSSFLFAAEDPKDKRASTISEEDFYNPVANIIKLQDSSFDRKGGVENFHEGGLSYFRGILPNNNILRIIFNGWNTPMVGEITDERGNITPLKPEYVMKYFLALLNQAKEKDIGNFYDSIERSSEKDKANALKAQKAKEEKAAKLAALNAQKKAKDAKAGQAAPNAPKGKEVTAPSLWDLD